MGISLFIQDVDVYLHYLMILKLQPVNLSYVAPAKPSLRVTCVAWFLSRLIDLTDGDDSLVELGLDLVLTSITGTAVDLQVGDFHM